MNKVSTIGIFLLASVSAAQATVIQYAAINLPNATGGEDLWQYRYKVSGFNFPANFGFDVFFDLSQGFQANDIQSNPVSPNAEWKVAVLVPDPILSANGAYDAQALVENASLAGIFTLNFIWRGEGIPSTQRFEVFDNTFKVIEAGNTVLMAKSNIDTAAPFYLASELGISVNPVFTGGTLRIDTPGSFRTEDFTVNGMNSWVGTIDGNGLASVFTGVFSDAVPGVPGVLTIANGRAGGAVTLTGVNTYTGLTTINSGATLALAGSGSINSSSGVVDNGVFDISGTTSGASIKTLAGNGAVNLGAKTLTLTSAANTFSGVIAGTGGLTVAGGSETLAGANTYTGGTAINPGAVLQLGNGGTSGGVVGNVTNNGSLVFNRSNDVTFSGSIAGSGRLIQAGTSSLNLTGTNTLGGGSFVQQGTLAVNGTLNSSVDVAAGTSLRGTGLIVGPTSVSGTLAPGNSPGTLTTAATVRMTNSSAFQADIDGSGTGNGAGSYSRLLVTGSGSQFIAGGTLMPVLRGITGNASNTFTPSLGDTFRIVTAQGGIVGRFAPLSQAIPGLASNTRLDVFYNVYGSNSIDLRVTPLSYAGNARCGGANFNAQSAGQALDRMRNRDYAGSASARQDQLLYSVAGLNSAQLPGTCLALAGEVHAAMAAAAPEAGRWLQGAVFRQLSASTGSEEAAGLKVGDNVWLDFNASQGRSDSDAFSTGYGIGRYQFAVGADILHSQTNRLGLGATYASTQVSPMNGSGTLEETAPFLYGQYAIGKAHKLIFDALVSYGFNTWQTERADPIHRTGPLKTNGSGNSALWGVGIRSPWEFEGFGVEPFVRVLWQNSNRGAIDEGVASAAALALPKYAMSGTRVMVGAAIGSEKRDPLTAAFTYRASVALGNDFGDLVRPTMQAALAGESLEIHSPHVGREFVQLNFSGTYRIVDDAYGYLGLNGEVRNNRLDGGVNAGFNLKF